MRKATFITTLIFGLLILLTLLAYIFSSTILSHILTSSLGTKTTVTNTVISFNHLRFWQINVANTTTSKNPSALTIDRIEVSAPLTAYFKNNIEIKEIELKGLTLVIETLPGNKKLTNWDEIVSHMNKNVGSSTKSTKDTVIDTLVIKDLTIKFVDPNGKMTVNTIKELKFKNLSTKDGNITSQITKAVLLKLILNVNTLIEIPVKLYKDNVNDFIQKKLFVPNS